MKGKMKIGIIGYQGSGKSTLFHWLTGVAPDPVLVHKTQSAMATVPEPRVQALCQIYHPKKVTLATLEIVDTPGLSRSHEGSATRLPFPDASFDAVLSFDLFEHIARVDRHVSEVHRVLKAGGYYLFQTPNKYSDVVFETLALRSLKWRRAHPSLHTPGQLRRRLESHGFDVRFVKMNPMNAYMRGKLKRLGPAAHLFEWIDFRKLPLGLQTNLYVIGQKR